MPYPVNLGSSNIINLPGFALAGSFNSPPAGESGLSLTLPDIPSSIASPDSGS